MLEFAAFVGKETLIPGTSNTSRRYDDEFKKQAVTHVVEEGLSVNRVCEDLGLQLILLTRLVEQNRHQVGPGAALSEGKELKQPRRELELVQTERDILKKAVREQASFSRPQE